LRQVLAAHPSSMDVRYQEIITLLHLRKKARALSALDRFRKDFSFNTQVTTQLEVLYASRFGSVGDVKKALDEIPADIPSSVSAPLISAAGGYLEAKSGLREALRKNPGDFGILWSSAYNQLMLCKFGEARQLARRALAVKARRFEKRVILCSYLFCVPTIFLAHLVYVAWRMAIGYFSPIKASIVFMILAPALYLPLVAFSQGWSWLGLPFGGVISICSVILHSLAMLSFEPGIAARLADEGKDVKLRGY